jgi:hydrogenase maturation protein HypF
MHTKANTYQDIHKIIRVFNQEVMKGKVVAIKGLGGFHLACDAFNEHAVNSLRSRKNREGKPFAVMFRDISVIKKYLQVNAEEEEVLLSWQRPILILKNKASASQLAPSISNGFQTTGAMLPYMPFHHLLLEGLQTPAIVLTSGNISDEPILIDNNSAISELSSVADIFITNNRDILNRTDDSVAMVTGNKPRLIRRSRGYVPSPVHTHLDLEGIFAAGAELVNCFAIGKGKQALLSQHIGDLKNLETLDFYEESFDRFVKMYRFEPEVFAVDLHPDYLSKKFCQEYDGSHLVSEPRKFTEVQHHHAHIASCMAEYGLDEKVIGISLDGVGFGTDGNIWGFEFLTCDLSGFQREYYPDYVPQPGGDLTTYEPWRMAVAYLYKVYGSDFVNLPLPILKVIEKERLHLVIQAIDKGINSPLTCSAGRLFDAVSAITGICLFSDFHAEAPMRLEQVVCDKESGSYDFHFGQHIETGAIIKGIVDDMIHGCNRSIISTKFHNTIAEIISSGCQLIRENTGIKKAVLSGGTFQNRYLLYRTEMLLQKDGIDVYSHERVPTNDGGIALGQLVIAAKRRSLGLL